MYADVRVWVKKRVGGPKVEGELLDLQEVQVKGGMDLFDELEAGSMITKVEIWDGDTLRASTKYLNGPGEEIKNEGAKDYDLAMPTPGLITTGSGSGSTLPPPPLQYKPPKLLPFGTIARRQKSGRRPTEIAFQTLQEAFEQCAKQVLRRAKEENKQIWEVIGPAEVLNDIQAACGMKKPVGTIFTDIEEPNEA